MLLMDIITWELENNDEVHKRYLSWEIPEGIKIINNWTDLSSCRAVIVYEAESTEAYAAFVLPWRDVCYVETFPVMETDDLMKFVAEYME